MNKCVDCQWAREFAGDRKDIVGCVLMWNNENNEKSYEGQLYSGWMRVNVLPGTYDEASYRGALVNGPHLVDSNGSCDYFKSVSK